MRKIRLATVFSGIGAIEQAFIKEKINFDIVFACDNGERIINQSKDEIDKYSEIRKYSCIEKQNYVKELYAKTKKTNFVKQSYFANYNILENNWHDDIRFIDGKQYEGKVDLFVGGSPCQSFSNMGKRGGLEDTRGTLFYEFARLVKEMKPNVFIYENVPGMLNHDGGNTWNVIKNVFDELGYSINHTLLNSKDYGIPQSRTRLYVVGFQNKKSFKFPSPIKSELTMFDFLEPCVEPKYYLREKGFKFVTQNTARAKVNEEIIRTQKANQQFNWNGNFVFQEIKNIPNAKEVLERAYVGTFKGNKGVARLLTPRECLRLMGFSDDFKIAVPDLHMYRQSGNSIVVNVLQNILKEIIKTGVFNEKD